MALIARRQISPERVVAICTAGDSVGNFVCLTDAGGGPISVESVDITNGAKIPRFGVIVLKINPTSCVVQVSGVVDGYSGLTPGKVHYVDFDSTPTALPPAPTIGSPRVYINAVGIAVDSTRIFLKDDITPSVRIL